MEKWPMLSFKIKDIVTCQNQLICSIPHLFFYIPYLVLDNHSLCLSPKANQNLPAARSPPQQIQSAIPPRKIGVLTDISILSKRDKVLRGEFQKLFGKKHFFQSPTPGPAAQTTPKGDPGAADLWPGQSYLNPTSQHRRTDTCICSTTFLYLQSSSVVK